MATTDTRRSGLDPPADDAASQAHRDMTRLRIKIAHRIASLRLLQSEPKVAAASPAEAEDSTARLPGNEGLTSGIGLEDHRRHLRREDEDDFTRDDDRRLPGRLPWMVPPHDHPAPPSPTEPDRVADRIVEAAVVALDQATSDLTEATARLQCIVEAVNNEAAAEIQLSAEAKAEAVEAKRRATMRARENRSLRTRMDTLWIKPPL